MENDDDSPNPYAGINHELALEIRDRLVAQCDKSIEAAQAIIDALYPEEPLEMRQRIAVLASGSAIRIHGWGAARRQRMN